MTEKINNVLVAVPWYKQFWPWFLIAFPAMAVLAGIATIIIAVNSDDGLVKDDYYKAGLSINQRLESTQKAKELKLKAAVEWDSSTHAVALNLSGQLAPLPSRLKLLLTHATRANRDQNITLFLAPGKKSYHGKTDDIKNGNWILILEPEDSSWRISGRANFSDRQVWHLVPE